MLKKKHVLVLGGGPDAEREVSIKSATGIAEALKAHGGYEVSLEIIDTLTAAQLGAAEADVIFPYLHGPYGEGGPLQDLLEEDGRPYVGSGPRASRWAMDKVATKAVAVSLGIETPEFWVLNDKDPVCPSPLPVIIKPVHEGSTIGLHVCTTHADYTVAVAAIARERSKGLVRSYMIEPKVGGQAAIGSRGGARELTVGLIDGETLPIIEIKPHDGLYDYQAKYARDDTQYILEPKIPDHVARKVTKATKRIAKALGIRHIARADFLLDKGGTPWFLEINTTPGFTDHSLVPKAAAHAGVSMPDLCARLVELAAPTGTPKGRRSPENPAAGAAEDLAEAPEPSPTARPKRKAAAPRKKATK
ncbi:MAG TPA: D-alanine--D-alanine ligase [Phycisphaerales bacterium]|nr:D-alanine--D-alanine ligase [Phycisphaerales bacterium]